MTVTPKLRYALRVIESLPEKEQDFFARFILYHIAWNMKKFDVDLGPLEDA